MNLFDQINQGLAGAYSQPAFQLGLGLLGRPYQKTGPALAGAFSDLGRYQIEAQALKAAQQEEMRRQQAARAAQMQAQQKSAALEQLRQTDPQMALYAQAAPGAIPALANSRYRKPDQGTSAMQNIAAMGLEPGTSAYQAAMREYMMRPTAPQMEVQFNPMMEMIQKGETEYVKKRGAQDAEMMQKAQSAAQAAYKQNKLLNRFVSASGEGYAGSVAPLKAAAAKFIASFGFDPKSLTNYTVMQSAISNILADYMSQLGARGLTDKDMEVLHKALPEMETSREAREQVASILTQDNNATISAYRDMTQMEDERFPDNRFSRPKWLKTWQPMQITPISALQEAMDRY